MAAATQLMGRTVQTGRHGMTGMPTVPAGLPGLVTLLAISCGWRLQRSGAAWLVSSACFLFLTFGKIEYYKSL